VAHETGAARLPVAAARDPEVAARATGALVAEQIVAAQGVLIAGPAGDEGAGATDTRTAEFAGADAALALESVEGEGTSAEGVAGIAGVGLAAGLGRGAWPSPAAQAAEPISASRARRMDAPYHGRRDEESWLSEHVFEDRWDVRATAVRPLDAGARPGIA